MTISVVIANRNYARFLPQCLGSLIEQTRRPDRIVLVDGQSEDGSLVVASRILADANICPFTLLSRPPRGMAHARNAAIQHTVADYILPLDSDDWLDPRCLELCELAAKCLPLPGIVAPSLRWSHTGAVQHPRTPVTLEHLLRENCIFASSMFPRRLFHAVGGYDEYPRTYEDWDLWIRMVSAGAPVQVLDDPLLNYRSHPGSSSARMRPGDHDEYVAHIRRKFSAMIAAS